MKRISGRKDWGKKWERVITETIFRTEGPIKDPAKWLKIEPNPDKFKWNIRTPSIKRGYKGIQRKNRPSTKKQQGNYSSVFNSDAEC